MASHNASGSPHLLPPYSMRTAAQLRTSAVLYISYNPAWVGDVLLHTTTLLPLACCTLCCPCRAQPSRPAQSSITAMNHTGEQPQLQIKKVQHATEGWRGLHKSTWLNRVNGRGGRH